MKHLVILAGLLMFTVPAMAEKIPSSAMRVRVALALEKAKRVSLQEAKPVAPVVPKVSIYVEACLQAQETGRPLAVFVNQPAKAVEGFITVSVKDLDGDTTVRVLVAKPGSDWPQWVSTIVGEASSEAIRRAVAPAPKKPLPSSTVGYIPAPSYSPVAWSSGFTSACRS